MRLHAGLPKMFWADLVNTAAYLINRGPSFPIGLKIPEEEWQGQEISLKHLNVFGCVSYVKVKDSEREKLEAKERKCTFIGWITWGTTSGITRIRRFSEVGMWCLTKVLYTRMNLQRASKVTSNQ